MCRDTLQQTKKNHKDDLVLICPPPPGVQLQHGYTLGGAVEMRGRAAPARGLQALCGPPQRGTPGPGAHDDP